MQESLRAAKGFARKSVRKAAHWLHCARENTAHYYALLRTTTQYDAKALVGRKKGGVF
jgi:hypothetical protein